jgi:hypothetical protein
VARQPKTLLTNTTDHIDDFFIDSSLDRLDTNEEFKCELLKEEEMWEMMGKENGE